MRNWTRDFMHAMGERDHEVELIPLRGPARLAALRPAAPWQIRLTRPDAVQYIPYSGLTRASLVRLRALTSLVPAAVKSIAVLQASDDVRRAPVGCTADVALFSSERLRRRHSAIARSGVVIPPVVDTERFHPAEVPRDEIRGSLGLDADRPMVLHVGHLAPSRGLDALAELARPGEWSVTMVASTSTPVDPEIKASLERAGVNIVRRYIPDIERYYQAADVYVFPVEQEQGSVEIPLSVLEAMACDTPVVATRFGGLPELFEEGDGVAYADASALGDAVRRTLADGGRGGANRVADLTHAALARAVDAGWLKERA
jgi:glycosyltransferase involved in cell wall biosynthesis